VLWDEDKAEWGFMVEGLLALLGLALALALALLCECE
jgi:hypothetical protein